LAKHQEDSLFEGKFSILQILQNQKGLPAEFLSRPTSIIINQLKIDGTGSAKGITMCFREPCVTG
jgi:hypothetical protein